MGVFTGGYTIPAPNAGSVHLQSRRDDCACDHARLRLRQKVDSSLKSGLEQQDAKRERYETLVRERALEACREILLRFDPA